MSLRGVSAVKSLDLSHIPDTVKRLDLSHIKGFDDIMFKTLFTGRASLNVSLDFEDGSQSCNTEESVCFVYELQYD